MLEVVRERYPALWPWLQLTRLDRPVGTLLLLWPTLWALWIAGEGSPSISIVIIFVLGVIVMRAAGCVINDYADRDFDGRVRRTRERPLATGALGPKDALLLFAALMLVAVGLLMFLNGLTFKLALVAAALAIIYPFTKRVTFVPQLFLGAAFAWAIPMAFAAQTGSLPSELWLLYTATLVWTIAYDTQYAMVDRRDDLLVGIKSTAILFGDADRLMIGILQTLTLWPLWLVGRRLDLTWPWYLGLLVAAGLFVYQQWLIREREEQACFRAFLNNQWVGASVFAGLVVSYFVA